MIIYLDMDGVLVDFHGSAIRATRGYHDTSPAELMRDYPRGRYWLPDILGITDDQFWEAIDLHGEAFWSNILEYDHHDDLWNLCRAFAHRAVPPHPPHFGTHQIYVATAPSRNAHCASGKVRKLQELYGSKFRNYVLITEKHLLARPGTVLIDDHDGNCDKFRDAGGQAIVFPRLWNSQHEHAAYPVNWVQVQLEKLANG